jgi:hypothetical protein
VTLALKNLVGINGDKNLLPHHCVGSEAEGGDEFPGSNWIDRTRSRASEIARRWLARGGRTGFVRLIRRAESTIRGDAFVRAGNWHGNKTTWRMCLDLNTCLYYNDKVGEHFDSAEPVRKVLSVADGIIAGEGEGPLSPRDRPLGVVLASLDPIALDLAAVRLMGFDEQRIPKIREAMAATSLRITSVKRVEDVEIAELSDENQRIRKQPLDGLSAQNAFIAHAGWRGFLELRSEGQVS